MKNLKIQIKNINKQKKNLFYITPFPIYTDSQEIPMTMSHSSRQSNKLVSETAAPAFSYQSLCLK